MLSTRNLRPALLAGVLLIAAAPQASAEICIFGFCPSQQSDQNKQTKPLVKPQRAQPQADARPLVRANPVHHEDADDFNLSSRTSLLEPDRMGPRSGERGYAAIPADADPNYSTPVDLDPSVNYKQATQRVVPDPTGEAAGTLTINTKLRKLYYSLGDGQAVEYGIAVGKAGFAWKGEASIGRKAYWPGWTPPPEMIERRPELPDHMDGSMSNPLGARALYLFQGKTDTLFRIHGTNEPSSIGHAASSGCIRMHNADVIDLYGRVSKGARVVVM